MTGWWWPAQRRAEKVERARRRAEFRDMVLNSYIVDTVDGDRVVRRFFDLRKCEVVRDGAEITIRRKPDLTPFLDPDSWGSARRPVDEFTIGTSS